MENRHWFVHVEWVTVFITLLGGFFMLDSKIETQNARTDRLYDMFVDNQTRMHELLNEMKKENQDRQNESQNLIREMRKENNDLIRDIHGRMCVIETKYQMQNNKG